MNNSTATNGRVSESFAPIGLTPTAADRRHGRRLNARLLAGIVCVLAAFSGFLLFAVGTSPQTHGVVVAVRDLPVGTRLRRADLAVVQAQLGESQAQVFVPAEGLEGVQGQELLAPVAAQQILARSQLTTGHRPTLQPGLVRMTVPVRPDTAVGGALRPGDLVTVLATSDKGKPTAQTRPVLERAVVDQVGQADGLTRSNTGAPTNTTGVPIGPSRPVAWVTLLMPEDHATSLALARWNGDLELVQLAPESATQVAP
ncbi:MAG: Flp pilus assembly protein CpaB [Chloroflexota bacterium]|nr:Flp pilus assembly protein CpaB [Chloroflexota bacterium]